MKSSSDIITLLDVCSGSNNPMAYDNRLCRDKRSCDVLGINVFTSYTKQKYGVTNWNTIQSKWKGVNWSTW